MGSDNFDTALGDNRDMSNLFTFRHLRLFFTGVTFVAIMIGAFVIGIDKSPISEAGVLSVKGLDGRGVPSAMSNATVIPANRVAGVTIALIDHAKTSVLLEMYELGNPSIVAALEAAHHRKVLVRVVSDPEESQSQSSDITLKQDGIMVRKLAVPGGIDHVKLLVVDDSRVLIGGVNLGYASSYTADADVELTGLSARDATTIFNQDWSAAIHSNSAASGIYGPFVTGSAIEPTMLSVIANAAGRCIILANYLSDYSIQDALVAAEHRGVKVTAVLNPTAYGEASASSWLRRGGVQVVLAPEEPYLHAKILACGGEAMIGSANFSFDGMSVNHELDVVLKGEAADKLTAFANQIEQADSKPR